jgi:hypothetical protein
MGFLIDFFIKKVWFFFYKIKKVWFIIIVWSKTIIIRLFYKIEQRYIFILYKAIFYSE